MRLTHGIGTHGKATYMYMTCQDVAHCTLDWIGLDVSSIVIEYLRNRILNEDTRNYFLTHSMRPDDMYGVNVLRII